MHHSTDVTTITPVVNASTAPFTSSSYTYALVGLTIAIIILILCVYFTFGYCKLVFQCCVCYIKISRFPSKNYEEGDDYTVCILCYEEYKERERIRILPCEHSFHCRCVTKYLVRNSGRCPICLENIFNYKPFLREHLPDYGTLPRVY